MDIQNGSVIKSSKALSNKKRLTKWFYFSQSLTSVPLNISMASGGCIKLKYIWKKDEEKQTNIDAIKKNSFHTLYI